MEEYSWVSAPVSLNFGFMGDGLSVPMLFTYIFVFAGATLFSIPYMERRFKADDIEESNEQYARFYTFFLLYGASVAGCMLATNLIQFFMFFELALVFSWLLVFMYGYGDRKNNSMVYFIWTHIGGGAFLVGILGVFWNVGSFEIADLIHIAEHSRGILGGNNDHHRTLGKNRCTGLPWMDAWNIQRVTSSCKRSLRSHISNAEHILHVKTAPTIPTRSSRRKQVVHVMGSTNDPLRGGNGSGPEGYQATCSVSEHEPDELLCTRRIHIRGIWCTRSNLIQHQPRISHRSTLPRIRSSALQDRDTRHD